MIKMAEEEGIAGKYWEKYVKQEPSFALYSPFLVCVAADYGFDLQSFHLCISQDYYFLQALLQAYRMAEDSAKSDSNKNLIRNLKGRVHTMIQTYQTTLLERWGFKEDEIPDMSPPGVTTNKYRDFLITTASGNVEGEYVARNKRGNIAAFTLASIAPYMRLYAHLCQTILIHLSGKITRGNKYCKWLEYYSSQEIKDLAKSTEDALNELSASLTKEELLKTERVYHQAMKIDQSTVVPLSRVQNLNNSRLTIFSNFNLTCSAHDCSAIFAQWPDIGRQYNQALQEYIKSTVESLPAIALDFDGLSTALEQVEKIEKKKMAGMEESEVLKDLSLDYIQRTGQNLLLQNGCRGFFQKIVTNENPSIDVHVISYCWSGHLIRSAFSSDLEALNIHSNELVYNENSITTGDIVKKLESPIDKLKTFKKILEQGRKRKRGSTSSSDQGKHLNVYIGSAVGDLLCLVEADIGIVFGSSCAALRKLGDYFGVKFLPLINGVVINEMRLEYWRPKCGILYTVDSWAEIEAFILGL